MKVSIKTIAKLANCSTATVSNVLNNKGMFSNKTRQKVLDIVHKHKYTLNSVGRTLRTGKSETIGITFYRPNADIFRHEFYLIMMSALERTMAENNYEIILSEYTDTMVERRELPPFLKKGKVDGMIVLGGFPSETIKLFSSTNIPVVMLDTYSENVDCIITDNKKAVENVMLEISKLGHTHVEYFGLSAPDYNTDMRIQGFLSGIEKYGFDKRKCKIRRNFAHIESVEREFQKVLEQTDKPTALIASNDKVAIELINAAVEAGIDVPNDLSIVGFDDIPMASLTSPKLTTIRTDIISMGREAALRLLTKIKNPNDTNIEKKVLLPKLVMRATLTKAKK
ncbi:MAG: LacI family DNA-binding transcriptional regulator [Opitutales bacterium]|nr:LacI family DNA-binding transcriptional regulator [Opitutales bacterium]